MTNIKFIAILLSSTVVINSCSSNLIFPAGRKEASKIMVTFCHLFGSDRSSVSHLSVRRSPPNSVAQSSVQPSNLQEDCQLIFILGWLQDDFRMSSRWLQDDFRMTSGWLGWLWDDFRTTLGWLRALREQESNQTLSYRRSLKYFVLLTK